MDHTICKFTRLPARSAILDCGCGRMSPGSQGRLCCCGTSDFDVIHPKDVAASEGPGQYQPFLNKNQAERMQGSVECNVHSGLSDDDTRHFAVPPYLGEAANPR